MQDVNICATTTHRNLQVGMSYARSWSYKFTEQQTVTVSSCQEDNEEHDEEEQNHEHLDDKSPVGRNVVEIL